MKATIGISPQHREEIAEKLSVILADEFVLYIKTLNAHWNIEGHDFYSKHIFFEKQYHELSEKLDDIAERIRTLGHYAPATLESFSRLTHFTEKNAEENSSTGFVKSLLNDHDELVMHLRGTIDELQEGLKDSGTADFITGLMEMHEKMAWMLRAHLQ